MKYLPNTLERQWHDVQLLETDSFHHMSPDGTCLLCQSSIMQQKFILFLHFIESCGCFAGLTQVGLQPREHFLDQFKHSSFSFVSFHALPSSAQGSFHPPAKKYTFSIYLKKNLCRVFIKFYCSTWLITVFRGTTSLVEII